MNKYFSVVIAALLFLTSCSMHEEIDLAKEGNGFYKIDVDMSQMMTMVKSMSGEKIPDSVSNKVMDTVYSLKGMIDSSGGEFTAEEKKYFYNGTMHAKMNMPENKMSVVLQFPVKNAADLKKFFAVYDKVDSLNKQKRQQEKETEAPAENNAQLDPSKGMMNGNLPFKRTPYVITDTSIERIALTKEAMQEQMGEEMKGAEMFMSQMNMMVTIKLPRPAKKLEGKNAKLSEDKRTVFLSASMAEMMDNADANTFKVIF
ncbi:MAG: hypothetical protein ACOVP7_06335 [Lacibacter sp.]